MYSAVYGTVNYKEPLKSFEIRVGHSPSFGHPSVAIVLQCAESDVKLYTCLCIGYNGCQSLRHKQFRHSAISTQKRVFVQKCSPRVLSHFDTGLDVSTHFLKSHFCVSIQADIPWTLS